MPIRERLRDAGERVWLPFALSAAIVLLAVVVDLLAPASVRDNAILGTVVVAFVAAYVVWPKPALLVFALFVLFYHTLGRWLSPELRHVDEIVVPILFVAAAIRTRPWRRGLIDPLRDGALLVMFVAGVGSSIVNGVPGSVWPLALGLLAKVFAFLYIVLWHDFTPRDVRQIYPLVLTIGVVVLALVPFEIADPVRFRAVLNLTDYSSPREGLPSVKSVFYQPVLFSWFTAFIALYLTAGYVVLRRWWLLIGAGLFGLGTVLAGRRRAIGGVAAAVIAGIAAFGVRTRDWRTTARAWWPVAAGGVLFAIVFAQSLFGLAQLTLEPGAQSTVARNALYQTSVLIARDDFPLGVGLGRFASAMSRDPYSPVYAHYGIDQIEGLTQKESAFVSDTFWPRILGETGVIGLAALLVFTAVLTYQLWRAVVSRRFADDGLVRAFILGTWMVFIQALIETLASSMFDSPPRIYLLFGAAGVALALVRSVPEPERSRVET